MLNHNIQIWRVFFVHVCYLIAAGCVFILCFHCMNSVRLRVCHWFVLSWCHNRYVSMCLVDVIGLSFKVPCFWMMPFLCASLHTLGLESIDLCMSALGSVSLSSVRLGWPLLCLIALWSSTWSHLSWFNFLLPICGASSLSGCGWVHCRIWSRIDVWRASSSHLWRVVLAHFRHALLLCGFEVCDALFCVLVVMNLCTSIWSKAFCAVSFLMPLSIVLKSSLSARVWSCLRNCCCAWQLVRIYW